MAGTSLSLSELERLRVASYNRSHAFALAGTAVDSSGAAVSPLGDIANVPSSLASTISASQMNSLLDANVTMRANRTHLQNRTFTTISAMPSFVATRTNSDLSACISTYFANYDSRTLAALTRGTLTVSSGDPIARSHVTDLTTEANDMIRPACNFVVNPSAESYGGVTIGGGTLGTPSLGFKMDYNKYTDPDNPKGYSVWGVPAVGNLCTFGANATSPISRISCVDAFVTVAVTEYDADANSYTDTYRCCGLTRSYLQCALRLTSATGIVSGLGASAAGSDFETTVRILCSSAGYVLPDSVATYSPPYDTGRTSISVGVYLYATCIRLCATV